MLVVVGLVWAFHLVARRVHSTWLRRSIYGAVIAFGTVFGGAALSIGVLQLLRATPDQENIMLTVARISLVPPMQEMMAIPASATSPASLRDDRTAP